MTKCRRICAASYFCGEKQALRTRGNNNVCGRYCTIRRTDGTTCSLFERSEFLIPTWVTPQYRATSKKKNLCVRSTNLGFSGGKICACVRLILVLVGGTRYVLCTRYVCTWYQPAEVYTYVRTFRPWTHTSDDSYIYQLSLVVATATVSFFYLLVMVGANGMYFMCTAS